MKKNCALIFVLFVRCCLASEQNAPYSCRLLPTHNNNTIDCMPIHPHFELGHAYQKNYNQSAQSTPEFQTLDQFAINYFTINQCLYNVNLTVQLFPQTNSPNIVFFENFTGLYNNQTCNIIKYTPKPDDMSLTYQVSSNQFTCRKHNIVLPRLFEQKQDSYRKCLFNNVKYLDNSIDCNIAHIFHYSAKQLFDFYENPNFQGFLSNHVVHAISNLGDQDWDFPPFVQWYFNYNFMFEMTININEPSATEQIINNFQNILPVVEKYRKTLRPWFVAIASQSPYKLDQTGMITLNETAYKALKTLRPWFIGLASQSPYQLDQTRKILINEDKYGAIYDNLKSNKFDSIITSHPDLSEVKIFVSKDYRTFYVFEVTHKAILLKQFDGFVVVYLLTYLDTPAILKTSFKSFKLYLEEEKILQINNC
ncbi:hypothetical protein ABPG72_004555 [Tetrahymena utriculariae]